MATTIDLTAKTPINIVHKIKKHGILVITVKENGVILPIDGATIFYKAGSIISKSVGSGIAITDGPNGEFEITFEEDDANTITTKTIVQHECNLVLSGETLPLFDGYLTLETTLF